MQNAECRNQKAEPLRALVRILMAAGGVGVLCCAMAAAQGQMKLTEGERKGLEAEAKRLWEKVDGLEKEGKVKEAMVVGEQALVVDRRLFGEVHPEVAGDHSWLAGRYEQLEELAAARRHRQEGLRLETLLHEPGHWHITDARVSLSELEQLQKLKPAERVRLREASATMDQVAKLHAQGAYAQANPLAEQALTIRRSVLGDRPRAVAVAAVWLGAGKLELGDFAEAEKFYRLAMQADRETVGETHPQYASDLHNLASLYRTAGDLAKAEPLYREAVEIRKNSLGDKHPDYALSLQGLAMLLVSTGGSARAEPLMQEAIEITKNSLGENHPNYATQLENLGAIYHDVGDLAKAEPLCKQALEIRRKALGERHPVFALSLNNLASIYERMGEYAKAEPLYEQAVEIRRMTVGESHPSYGDSLWSLGSMYDAMGADEQAEDYYLKALALSRESLELAARGQSERQQLAMLRSSRHQLDQLIAVAARRRSGAKVYDEVLAWKGLVLGRQQQLRAALAAKPELASVWEEFRAVAGRLSVLSFETPLPAQAAAWQAKVSELSAQKEALEARLAAASAEYRKALVPSQLEDVWAALPAGAVLVDFLAYDYTDHRPTKERGGILWEQRTVEKDKAFKPVRNPVVLGGGLKKWESRLAAFVVRGSGFRVQSGEGSLTAHGVCLLLRATCSLWI